MSAPFKFIDLAGKRFGRLVAVVYAGNHHHREQAWLCKCDCGNVKTVIGRCLRNGDTKSCGCLPTGRIAHGEARNGAASREYRAWQAMKRRCSPKSKKDKPVYFDRSISVCVKWAISFEAFLRDMGRCPKNHQLERQNNSKGYEPGNCIWATGKQNCRNKRNNRVLTFKGKSRTVTEWSEVLGVPVQTVFSRLHAGWPIARILTA